MKHAKLVVVLLLALITGVGVTMLGPAPAEAGPPLVPLQRIQVPRVWHLHARLSLGLRDIRPSVGQLRSAMVWWQSAVPDLSERFERVNRQTMVRSPNTRTVRRGSRRKPKLPLWLRCVQGNRGGFSCALVSVLVFADIGTAQPAKRSAAEFSKPIEIKPARRQLIRPTQLPIAQADATGRLFVLDAQRNLIDVYDSRGLHAFSFPGQVSQSVAPRAFAITTHGILGIVGLHGRTVSLFDVGERSARFIRNVTLPKAPTSICAVGKFLFVYLPETDGMVYRISATGKASIAFRIPMEANTLEMQKYLYDAMLFGVEEDETIVAMSLQLPRVSAFSVSGRVLWRRNLRDFRQIEISQVNDYTMVIGTPKDGHHTLGGGYSLGNRVFALQLSLVTPGGNVGPGIAETRFIDLRDGSEMGRSTTFPAAIASAPPLLFGFDAERGSFRRYVAPLQSDRNP